MSLSQAQAKPFAASIRSLQPADNAALAAIIREVLPAFVGTEPGTVLDDPELDCLHEAYRLPQSAYFVAEQEGHLVGGAGIAPLKGSDGVTCELQKMYLLPQARGQGLGQQLLSACFAAARQFGFTRCYLETFAHMDAAQAAYLRAGFAALTQPLGSTGHFRCNRWYAKEL